MAGFDAFISYSRQASSTLAVALRNGIERFAKPWYKLRSSRVFLDDASMSANTGLWSNIERGLTEAGWFILLCSPKSAASEYVTTEIAWWLEHKTPERILMVLDEGEIAWDAETGDFDWQRATAVNPALSRAFAEEPRWVDLSWFELDDSLRDADPRFPERVADLAAAIRFQERDELVGENVRERRRALRLLRGGVVALSVLLVASLIATVLAVRNGNAATEQARIALARQLAAQAITLSRTDLQTASLLAVEANRLSDDSQTRAALFQLATASPALVRALPAGAPVTATAVTADGTVLTGDATGEVELWREDGSEVVLTFADRVVAVATSADHRVLAAVSGNNAAVWVDGRQEELDLESAGWDGSTPTDVSVSPDGRYLAVSDPNTATSVFEAAGGGYAGLGTVPRGGQVGWAADELTVMDPLGQWARVALDGLAILDSGWHAIPMSLSGSAVSADGRILAGQTVAGVNYSLWYARGSISGGGSVDGDPADLVATSQVSAPLDLELDEHGSRLAMLVDGAIYVAEARDPTALPEQPLVLDGAGRATPSTLSFAGEHLASGSGEFALLWDLRQAGRIVTEAGGSIAEPCRACGPPLLRVSPDGTRVLTTDVSGNDTYVTEVATGATVRLEDADGGYSGATWVDDDRIVAYSLGARGLRILSGTGFSLVDATVPVELGAGAYAALAIASDGVASATILDEGGLVQVVDLTSGSVTASTDALRAVWDGSAPFAFGIAPDRSTAFVVFSTAAGLVDLGTGRLIYRGTADGAAYDGGSQLHVFADGTAWTVDRAGDELVAPNPAAIEPVPAPVLSPDGQIVVTGGQTGTMSLVALDGRGSVFGRIGVPVETDRFAVSSFTADGSALLTAIQPMGDRPATLRRLDLTREGWRAAACALAGRNLTPGEWQTYVGTEPPGDLRCGR
ncbi:MAG: toll/interleukin-1 receptor domain-containing protein [Propionibacteriaceae bacterium]|nr:toll/interleukin-1 receptor domain-containing protein [Propionibacteriaceae bacterium]